MKNYWQKIVAGTAIGIATVGSFGVAFGWWSTTANGEGSGDTTVGVTGTLTFTTSSINAMYPGDAAQNFTVTVKNTHGSESVYVDEVNFWVTTDKTGCDGDDFLFNGSPAPSSNDESTQLDWTDRDMAAGASYDTNVDTIQFNNKSVDQDACKGAAVTLHYDVPAANDPPAED